MPMTEQQWTVLADYLKQVLPRAAPDWTSSNTHDPGITVLEVLNYALTDLQLRTPLDDGARALAQAVADQATALARAYGTIPPRIDPYRNFKFRVKYDGSYVAGVHKVSALERTTEVVEFREGGDPTTQRVPGATRYAPITLERGITYDRDFETWANASAGASAGSPNVIPREVVIELFDEAGRLFSSYKVWGCWVSRYQALSELDADGAGALLETVRLECEGWQRIDPA
jgi:phage tail-like protein